MPAKDTRHSQGNFFLPSTQLKIELVHTKMFVQTDVQRLVDFRNRGLRGRELHEIKKGTSKTNTSPVTPKVLFWSGM